MGKQPQIVEIKMAAVEAMVERAKGLLAKEDHDLLKGLVDTLLTLVGLVRKGRTTIARLRRLVGMVSTEKTTEVLGKLSEGEASAADGTADPAEHNEEKPAAENNAAAGKQSSTTETAASPKPDTGAQAATKPKGHGRLPASDYPDATHITVAHESLSPGDICRPAVEASFMRSRSPPGSYALWVRHRWWRCAGIARGCAAALVACPTRRAHPTRRRATSTAKRQRP